MKILAICSSGRKRSNTAVILRRMLDKAASLGAETELVECAGLSINHCTACEHCMSKGDCVIKDDYQMINEKARSADGLILGSPNYSFHMSSQMKAVFDRSHMLLYYMRALKGKHGVGVSVGGHPYRTDLVAKTLAQGTWLCGGWTVGYLAAVSKNRDEMELVDSEAIMSKADRLAAKLVKAVSAKKTYFFQGMLRRFTLDPALKRMVGKLNGRYEFLNEAYANK